MLKKIFEQSKAKINIMFFIDILPHIEYLLKTNTSFFRNLSCTSYVTSIFFLVKTFSVSNTSQNQNQLVLL